jgi:hypothetical protein
MIHGYSNYLCRVHFNNVMQRKHSIQEIVEHFYRLRVTENFYIFDFKLDVFTQFRVHIPDSINYGIPIEKDNIYDEVFECMIRDYGRMLYDYNDIKNLYTYGLKPFYLENVSY